jgi:hypothetical protein
VIIAAAVLLWLRFRWDPVVHGEAVATEEPAEIELGTAGLKVPLVQAVPVTQTVLVADASPTRQPPANVLGHFMCIPFQYWPAISAILGICLVISGVVGVPDDGN